MKKIYLLLTFYFFFTIIAFNSCKEKHHEETPVIINDKRIEQNITYGSNKDWHDKEQPLLLDIYHPLDTIPGKKYPLIVYIHGGGFHNGDKENTYNKCHILSDSGFIVASINYRIGWDKGSNPCNGNEKELVEAAYRTMQDANAALRFLVANATKYTIDTSWVFVCGSSAGAITALCVNYFDDSNIKKYYPDAVAKLGGLNTAGNTITNTFNIKGLCSMSGALPDTNLITTRKGAPTIFFHGLKDETVPAENGYYAMCDKYPLIFGSVSLYTTFSEKGIPAVAHILQDGGHGADSEDDYTDQFKMSNTACFFHSIMQKNIQKGFYTNAENSCP